MRCLIQLISVCIFLIVGLVGPAGACIDVNGMPAFTIIPTKIDENGSVLTLEISPLLTTGSVAGRSCAVMAELPAGMSVLSVEVVNAGDAQAIGFDEFRHSQSASENLCDPDARHCSALVAKVGESGIPALMKVKFIVRLKTADSSMAMARANIAKTIGRIHKRSSFLMGQVNDQGMPGDHLVAITPRVVEVNFGRH